MIELITATSRFVLKPTIFPDGTSQVWKLPEDVLRASNVNVTWRFENEREIIDILSLNKLLKNQLGTLHIPYMPYARQDKIISNTSTFNLEVMADLINSMNASKSYSTSYSMGFTSVTSVDVHNPSKTEDLINYFTNIEPNDFHAQVISASEPDTLVFPDHGAASRYKNNPELKKFASVICDKTRDQLTGQITGHEVAYQISPSHAAGGKSTANKRFLIIDDLCDGGATFISVAKMLRTIDPNINIDLCVTHGLFSKGREHLLTNGINKLYTTNSLTQNGDGYDV
jgi:ribose-phosphate pyrophosphokinase